MKKETPLTDIVVHSPPMYPKISTIDKKTDEAYFTKHPIASGMPTMRMFSSAPQTDTTSTETTHEKRCTIS